MFVVILILTAIIIFRKPDTITIDAGREKVLTDSLSLMSKEIEASHKRQDQIQHNYDSLLTLDPPVQYRSYEKIKFIYSGATTSQLDSIIRATWKTDLRHN